jgi:hypothetical protein
MDNYRHSSGKQHNETRDGISLVAGSIYLHATQVDSQLDFLNQRNVCQGANQQEAYEWTTKGAPECLHVDRGLEHQEHVSVIVRVEFFAIRTKVLGAEGAAVPLPCNTHHVSVAKSEGMGKVAKIGWYDPAVRCW